VKHFPVAFLFAFFFESFTAYTDKLLGEAFFFQLDQMFDEVTPQNFIWHNENLKQHQLYNQISFIDLF
jgi:hypothetical protein